MREIVETINCPQCGALITEIVHGDTNYLELGVDPSGPTPFVVRLVKNGSDYRFFCRKCGAPTQWNAGSREFLEFAKDPSLDSMITAEGRSGQWKFARLNVRESILDAMAKNPCSSIRNCASAFASNVARVNEIAESTLLTIGLNSSALAISLHMLQAFTQERHKFARNLGDDPESEYMKEFVSAIQMLDSLKQPLSQEMLDKMRLNGEVILDTWAQRHHTLISGIQALLLAQLSLAWTAFEVLSSDLWVAAVNDRPKPLATNFAKSDQQKTQDKNITITSLAKYAGHDFNLSGVMGDLFVSERKADLTSLESTRVVYERTFGQAMAMFCNEDLRLLELVRNLTLHRGGIVDQVFIDRLAKSKLDRHQDCVGVEKDKPFHVDGDVANRLATAAAQCGAELLKFVTEYLYSD